MPVDRTWTVPEEHGPEIGYDEQGNLLIQPRVVGDNDDDALWEAFLEARAILRRVGGTIQMASQRAEIAPGVVITESYIIGYNSFTPLVRKLAPEQPEQAGDESLTADELAPHFPESPLEETIQQVQAEEPATDDPAAEQELERAGTVVE